MKAVGELEGLYAKLSEKAAEVARRAVEAQNAKVPGKATDKLFEATRRCRRCR